MGLGDDYYQHCWDPQSNFRLIMEKMIIVSLGSSCANCRIFSCMYQNLYSLSMLKNIRNVAFHGNLIHTYYCNYDQVVNIRLSYSHTMGLKQKNMSNMMRFLVEKKKRKKNTNKCGFQYLKQTVLNFP